jgi:hypothetical protein
VATTWRRSVAEDWVTISEEDKHRGATGYARHGECVGKEIGPGRRSLVKGGIEMEGLIDDEIFCSQKQYSFKLTPATSRAVFLVISPYHCRLSW